MKNLFFAFLILFSNINCKKENTPANAIIVGYDMRLCPSPCCGGFFVDLNPNNNSNKMYYQWLPGSTNAFGIDDKTTFPLSVSIEYSIDSASCGGFQGRITITKLVKF